MINIVTFNDIVNGLKLILSTNFIDYNIYFEEIKQEMARPAFHINMMPLTSNNFNQYYREQRCLVDISYFSEESTDLQSNFKNLEMSNKIQSVLNTDIKVLDRNLNLQELEFETVDRILHTTFNLMWYNENEVTQAYLNQFQLMEHFTVTFENDICYEYYVTSLGEVFKASDGDFYIKCTDAEIEMLRDRNLIKI